LLSFILDKRFVFFLIIFFMSAPVFSQIENQDITELTNDTLAQTNTGPNVIKSLIDSVSKDSTIVDVKKIKIAENDLDDNVKYNAADSIIYDIPNKTVLLFGNARITYQEMDMRGGYIRFNWDSSEVYARATPDSSGNLKRIEFKDGTGEYVAMEAKFNFKTKKGKSAGLVTKEMEGYLHGDYVKAVNDSTLYIKNARYTTCSYDQPHFYVEIGKAKVIKDRIIVGKPANIIIEGVRTPLFLPFALVPSIKSKGSGLIMPTYGEAGNLGFYLSGIGYYWHINDKMDLTTTADIYTLGSWALRTNLNYKVIYKHAGSLSFNINQQRGGSDYERFNPKRLKAPINFGLQWQMNVDPKKMYNSSFNINLNIVSNKTYQYLNSRDPQSVLATNFSSNISYSKYWPNKPYRLALNTGLVQNTQSKQISLTLPQFSFNVTRINPFQKKVAVTKRKWYENIGFSYDLNVSNQISATDSTFLSKQTLKNMRTSITHNLPISGNFTLFKYLNFNVGFNYRENWYFSYVNKTYQDTLIRLNETTNRIDTFLYQAVPETKFGFKTYRDFNFNMSFNTNLYGQLQFKKGKLKAIRHVFRPSLNFNFSPDFTAPLFKYMRTVQIDSFGNTEKYSIFQNNGIIPPGKQGSIGINFSNSLEIKVYSRKDTINHTKKITLLDNLSVGMSYNLLTKRFSPLSISASTRITDKLNFSMNMSLDPYALDSLGGQTNTFYYKERKQLFRLSSLNISLSGSIHSKKGLNEQAEMNKSLYVNQGLNNQFYQKGVYERDYYNFNIPWSINYQYSLNLARFKYNKKDTTAITQTLALGFDLNITKKWKINVSSGFDLTHKSVTRTDISVVRDLHCWQMEFKWTPLGFQQGFYMTVYVTSQQFSWLKLQKQKAFFESGFFGSGFNPSTFIPR
jgi:lipopolysaccharide assembly outer membrane protein LptD (OstA)